MGCLQLYGQLFRLSARSMNDDSGLDASTASMIPRISLGVVSLVEVKMASLARPIAETQFISRSFAPFLAGGRNWQAFSHGGKTISDFQTRISDISHAQVGKRPYQGTITALKKRKCVTEKAYSCILKYLSAWRADDMDLSGVFSYQCFKASHRNRDEQMPPYLDEAKLTYR